MNRQRKERLMGQDLDLIQAGAGLEVMLFLNDTLSRTSQLFEQETSCSPEEANVIRVLAEHGPLMVKEIAQVLPGIDPSKLTRLLDSLEKQGYATRTLNPENRRSFLVAPTERVVQLLEAFTHHLKELAQGMLTTLTPTERLVIVELFSKIQTNWPTLQDS